MAFIRNNNLAGSRSPYIEILVQPMQRFRFRYMSEVEGSHGSLLGEGSERGKKIFISAKLHNYKGPVSMRVSLATVPNTGERPKRHAHQLSGRSGCSNGVYNAALVPEDDMTCSLQGVWITHIARKNVVNELKRIKLEMYEGHLNIPPDVKRQLSIEAAEEAKTLNLNTACLCFEAVVTDPHSGVQRSICDPVYSVAIYNLKSTQTGELRICRMSKCSGLCKGDDEVWILVEKVRKGNVQVRFFEENEDDEVVWSANAIFQDTDVHRQHAIVFRTPPYKDLDIREDVKVKFQLFRPTDSATSDPLDFTFRPVIRVPARKRTTTCMTNPTSAVTLKSPRLPPIHIPAPDLDQGVRLNTPDVVKLVDQWVTETALPTFTADQASAEFHSSLPSDPGPIPEYTVQQDVSSSPFIIKMECTSPAQFHTSSPTHHPASPQQQQQVAGTHVSLGSPVHVAQQAPAQLVVTTQNSANVYQMQSPMGHLSVNSGGFPISTTTMGSPQHISSALRSPGHYSVSSGASLSPGMAPVGSPCSYNGSSSSYPSSPAMHVGCGTTEGAIQLLNSNDIIEGLEAFQMIDTDLTTDGQDLTTDSVEETPGAGNERTKFVEVTDEHLSALVVDVLKNLKPGQNTCMRRSFEKLLQIRTTTGNSAIHLAVYQEALPLLRLLMSVHADKSVIYEHNDADMSPFHLAVEIGNPGLVRAFLSVGASVDSADVHGDTALHKAASLKRVDVLRLLLKKATAEDINRRNHRGRTPLHEATCTDCKDTVEELLKAGAYINQTDSLAGYTALHMAAEEKLEEVCKLLVAQDDIDGELEAFSGATPYDLAKENSYDAIVDILESAGLKTDTREELTPSYV